MDKGSKHTSVLRRLAGCAFLTVALLAAGCGKDPDFDIDGEPGAASGIPSGRQEHVETRRVLLLYEAGFNSLHAALDRDVNEELIQGYVPKAGRDSDVLLVYTKLAIGSAYKPVKSYLKQLYTNTEGKLVTDTLAVFDETMAASSAEGLHQVTSYVKSRFPAKGYGMIFSSHGSGWLPAGYYYSPSNYEEIFGGNAAPSSVRERPDIPTGTLADDPFAGMVRSLGWDEPSDPVEIAMTTEEFAGAIAMHLDYLLFDMCYSAGAELFYACKDVADYIGGSPTEVMGDGMFDYSQLTGYLLRQKTYDLEGLYQASFDRYDRQSGYSRSATAMLIRTDGLERLAAQCRTLVGKYRRNLENVTYSNIQGYYRQNRHYFFDLVDTFVQCGASAGDVAALEDALDACTVFKAATPYFLYPALEIRTYSGMSIYLPCSGTPLLNESYKSEPWNLAIGLEE